MTAMGDTGALPTAERLEAEKVLAPRIRTAAARLRDEAERLDALADRIADGSLVAAPWVPTAPYSVEVGRALHSVNGTLANLSVGGIIVSAGTADTYRAKGE